MGNDEVSGRSKGGFARKNALSPTERKAIAERAAAVRWGKPLVATHKGNFQAEFGTDVECYVLNDALHTAVISQTGMAKAIGLSSRGNALPRFLASHAMSESLGAELSEKLQNPLKFQWRSGGAQSPPTEVHGYDATILVDLCKAIIQADAAERLKPQQKNAAIQAAIIIAASAKSGIKGLVYALAGYSPSADEVIQAFKLYVQEEARRYEQEFPNELYMQWHRLYEIPVPLRGKPWQFKHLTVNHIYYPLAKSNGRILELMRALKAKQGDRQKKLFQFLNEVGARALRIQIGRVLEMSESSNDSEEYETKVKTRFGSQPELDFGPATEPVGSPCADTASTPPS
jgi:P63C domain